MEHQLKVVVRLDIDQNSARLDVTGCLTDANYKALFPIIRRAASLVNGLGVVVDLKHARHIDSDGLARLTEHCAGISASEPKETVSVDVPAVRPECHALTHNLEGAVA